MLYLTNNITEDTIIPTNVSYRKAVKYNTHSYNAKLLKTKYYMICENIQSVKLMKDQYVIIELLADQNLETPISITGNFML